MLFLFWHPFLDDFFSRGIVDFRHGVNQHVELVLAESAHEGILQKRFLDEFSLLRSFLDHFEDINACLSAAVSFCGNCFSQVVVCAIL
jgi:hypothetical protein